jgi:prevent-host-death family protein
MAQAGLTELRTHGRETIGKVQFGGERIILEHRGRPVAALVSVEDLEWFEELEDQELIRLADEAEAEPGPNIPWEQAKKELGL